MCHGIFLCRTTSWRRHTAREIADILSRQGQPDEALETVLVVGLATAMNRTNRDPEDETAEAPGRNE